jgi:hypothetical protein
LVKRDYHVRAFLVKLKSLLENMSGIARSRGILQNKFDFLRRLKVVEAGINIPCIRLK